MIRQLARFVDGIGSRGKLDYLAIARTLHNHQLFNTFANITFGCNDIINYEILFIRYRDKMNNDLSEDLSLIKTSKIGNNIIFLYLCEYIAFYDFR